MFCRQNKQMLKTIGTACALLALPLMARAGEPKIPAPLVRAETALTKLAKGDLREAAKQTAAGLQAAPEDATLHTLAGVLLMNAGEFRGAQTAFERAIALVPEDGLATYGRGLCLLTQGSPQNALNQFQIAERQGVNITHLLLARRYTQWLAGAQIALDGAGLPDALAAAQHGLEGMARARTGDPRRAVSELEAAMTAESAATVPNSGLRMRFDAQKPLTGTQPALPANHGLVASLPKERAVSGTVSIQPENVTSDVAYVSYELDGQALSLVNQRPFHFVWDSRRATNGWHTLNITFYDSRGNQSDKQARKLRTYNADAAQTPEQAERQATLKAAMWDALTLRPDVGAVAYTLGTTYKALGDAVQAKNWMLKAAAAAPDFRDTRAQLASMGGIAVPQEAIWGGLPSEKIVALTFDDGPKPGLTEPLLEILTKERVPATFFVIGRHVTAYPDLTRQIVGAGMELANHSYSHPNLTKIGDAGVAREIMQTQNAIFQATGKLPRFVRPPGGNWNNNVAKVCRDWGMIPCMWTVDVYGSEVIGAQSVADAILMQVRPGSVILMHNGKLSTLQALPTVIRELKKRGYGFATVETMYNRLSMARAAERQAAIQAANLNKQRGE